MGAAAADLACIKEQLAPAQGTYDFEVTFESLTTSTILETLPVSNTSLVVLPGERGRTVYLFPVRPLPDGEAIRISLPFGSFSDKNG